MTNTDARALAHSHDPDTSHDAAARASAREELKNAILWILRHDDGEFPTKHGMAAFEVQEAYLQDRVAYGWPDVQPHSIPRRMSELHNEHRIHDTGVRVPTPFGRLAVVWAVTPD